MKRTPPLRCFSMLLGYNSIIHPFGKRKKTKCFLFYFFFNRVDSKTAVAHLCTHTRPFLYFFDFFSKFPAFLPGAFFLNLFKSTRKIKRTTFSLLLLLLCWFCGLPVSKQTHHHLNGWPLGVLCCVCTKCHLLSSFFPGIFWTFLKKWRGFFPPFQKFKLLTRHKGDLDFHGVFRVLSALMSFSVWMKQETPTTSCHLIAGGSQKSRQFLM